MDLQWKKPADYNASPCAHEGKVAGAKTMEIQWKKQCAKQSEQPDVWLDVGRQATALRESPPCGLRRFGVIVTPG
jgi:hypothetical protein